MGRPKGSKNKTTSETKPIHPFVTMDMDLDYSFKEDYNVGDWIWYVQVNELTNSKRLIHVRVRTIYPTVLICVEEDSSTSVHISSSEKDMIFPDEKTAREVYNNTTIQPVDWSRIIAEVKAV